MLREASATFEIQFMKMVSNTCAELKKPVSYKIMRVYSVNVELEQITINSFGNKKLASKSIDNDTNLSVSVLD